MKQIPIDGLLRNDSQIQHQRDIRLEKAKKDLRQTVFFQTEGKEVSIKSNPHKFAIITEKGIDPFKNTTCPFCLGISRLRLFLISTKKGFDRGKGKCPLCGQGMRLQTLVKMETWKPEEYAAFVFGYRTSGFWQKIDFATWKKRLGLMGWTQPFWDEYKRLRGDGSDALTEEEKRQVKEYEKMFA